MTEQCVCRSFLPRAVCSLLARKSRVIDLKQSDFLEESGQPVPGDECGRGTVAAEDVAYGWCTAQDMGCWC